MEGFGLFQGASARTVTRAEALSSRPTFDLTDPTGATASAAAGCGVEFELGLAVLQRVFRVERSSSLSRELCLGRSLTRPDQEIAMP